MENEAPVADYGVSPEARLRAEFEFVMARSEAARKHRNPRCYGLSSDAMALYGLGRAPRPQVPGHTVAPGVLGWTGEECGTDYPHDLSDLDACERTFRMAPPWVQDRMAPVLEDFRDWVIEGRNRHGEVIERMAHAR